MSGELRNEERTGFKTNKPYSPEIDIQTDFVMIYGLSDDMTMRANSWKQRGYAIHLTENLSWGDFRDYLDGKYDSAKHWDEVQTGEDGRYILRKINSPMMVPTLPFVKYMTERLKTAVDSGIFDIHLEEAEFSAEAGYSPAFKREWEMFYLKPWQPPHLSADAQYKASKLKSFLLTRAVSYIGTELKYYAKTKFKKDLKFYLSAHSLMNYASINTICPESSVIAGTVASGSVAQIWTGTSRIPNMYNGKTEERTFLTSFLEYGYMEEIARNSNKKMWFMHDPVEDTVSYGWDDYRYNYTRTLIASLYHSDIRDYEVCPWVDRVINGSYPRNTVYEAKPIPPRYKTTLLTIVNMLGNMSCDARWETPDTHMGILISDTALYQRLYPRDDPYGNAYADAINGFSGFYGLALPFLERGIPLHPIPLENITRCADYLKKYKVLLLSYEFMKPQSPAVHYVLSDWVKNGGILVYVGDGSDSFHKVEEWWNTGTCKYETPADHLVEIFGLTSKIKTLKKKSRQTSRILLDGMYSVGKGYFAFYDTNPSNCAREAEYAHFLRKLVYVACEKSGKAIATSKSLIMNRGPYKIVAVMADENKENVPLNGHFVNMLSHNLETETFIVAEPGSIHLLYDIDTVGGNTPEAIAVTGRLENESKDENRYSATVHSPDNIHCVFRLYCPFEAKLEIDGKEETFTRDETGKTIFFEFEGKEKTKIEIFKIAKAR